MITLAAAASVGPMPNAWAANETPTSQPTPRFSMVAINAADMNKSVDFYTRLLGMKEQRRYSASEVNLGFPGSEPTLLIVGPRPPRPDSGAPANAASRPAPQYGGTRFGIWVSDLEALVKKLDAAGVTIRRQPLKEAANGIVVSTVLDPDGNVIELTERL
jgi:lactoylglutathione lyase